MPESKRTREPAFVRAAKIDPLSEGYDALGKRSLKSPHNIISKIRFLAQDLKDNPKKQLSDSDLEAIKLIEETLPEIVAELQSNEDKKLLSGIDRYIRILKDVDKKRKEKDDEKEKTFDVNRFLMQELPRKEEFKAIRSLVGKTQKYELSGVELRDDYPNQNIELDDQLDQVDNDLITVNELLKSLNVYEKIDVHNESFSNQKITQIRDVIRPVWEKLKAAFEERKREIEDKIAEKKRNEHQKAVGQEVDTWRNNVLEKSTSFKKLDEIQKKPKATVGEYTQAIEDLDTAITALENDRDNLVNGLSADASIVALQILNDEVEKIKEVRDKWVEKQWELFKGAYFVTHPSIAALEGAVNVSLAAGASKADVLKAKVDIEDALQALKDKIIKDSENLHSENYASFNTWYTDLVAKIDAVKNAEIKIKELEKKEKDIVDKEKKMVRDSVEKAMKPIRDLELETEDDYRQAHITIAYLEGLKKSLRREVNNSGLQESEFPDYALLIQKIDEYIEIRKSPKYLSWLELEKAIGDTNMDPWEHLKYRAAGTASQYEKDLYIEFHKRKAEPSAEPSKKKETAHERRNRIDVNTIVQISTLDNEQQYENQRASTKRSNLFEQLQKRDVDRGEYLEGTTCHPIYGEFINEILQKMIIGACTHGSPIHYNKIVDESNGRSVLEGYIRTEYSTDTNSLKDRLESVMTAEQIEEYGGIQEVVDRVFKLCFKTFYGFVLIDPAFAELQKQTATQAHNTGDNDINRVQLTRPDAAAVHLLTRYSNLSNPAAWWYVYTPPIRKRFEIGVDGRATKESIGNTQEKNTTLSEIQDRLLLHQEAHFPTRFFREKIRFTSLFEPLFPDTYQFLLPQRACLGFGSSVENSKGEKCFMPELIVVDGKVFGHTGYIGKAGKMADVEVVNSSNGKLEIINTKLPFKSDIQQRSQYTNAEEAWMKILEYDFKPLGKLTEEDILTGHGDKKGILDDWIALAGRAKMFPGRHLDEGMGPMLTHLIQRMFSAYPERGHARARVYEEVIEKLEQSIRSGGLERYACIINDVIRNISYPHKPGKAPGEALQPYVTRDRIHRINYVNYIWKHKKRRIPKGGPLAIANFGDPYAEEYWEIINLEKPLPDPEVNRKGGLEKPKEEVK